MTIIKKERHFLMHEIFKGVSNEARYKKTTHTHNTFNYYNLNVITCDVAVEQFHFQ